MAPFLFFVIFSCPIMQICSKNKLKEDTIMQDTLFAVVKLIFESNLEAKERKEELLEEMGELMQQNTDITVLRRDNRVEIRMPWVNPLGTILNMVDESNINAGMQLIADKVFEILDTFPDDWKEMKVSLYWHCVDND